jgi:uncharacterized membrane protein YkoI
MLKGIAQLIVAIGAVAMIAAQPVAAQGKETQAQLKKAAKVTQLQARATALKEVPNGRVQKSELERENGNLIYSFDIKIPGKSGFEEVNVDAITGKVVNREHETPKMEAKEKAMKK